MTTTTQRTVIAAWALFVSVVLLMLGRGLVGVLAGVRAELEGFDTTVTGVIVASYFVGFLIGSQVTPRIMARVGHIRVFSALSAMIVVAILAQGIWVAPVPWMLLRLLFGFGMVGLVVVAESWLNDTVTNDNRGRVMAIYMVASMGGVAGGQFLLGAGDPSTEILFIVSASLIALAIVPVSLSTSSAPEFKLPPRMNPREIWDAAPIGVVGALFTGMANATLLGMAAVYASQVGMTVERTALFAGAAAVGAVFLQYPIGLISDTVGRRPMILVVSSAAIVIAGVGLTVPVDGWGIIGVMFLFGGMSYTMYSLALSHVIDVLPPGRAVTASSTNVFLTGVGAIIGPILAAASMTAIGPSGFWWTLVFAFSVIAVFSLYRVIVRPTIKGLSPEPYMAVPARSTGIVRLVRRTPRKNGSLSNGSGLES